ncbi:MAG: hypothetical protein ABI361_01510 [Nitrososphaera sp.]|jgi:hypothetical protein
MGAIDDFAFACAVDESPGYFTYEGSTMIIVQAAAEAKANLTSFTGTELFMPLVISHESLHVVIKALEGPDTSESLDDVEVIIVDFHGRKIQLTINILAYASDNSGIVFP